MPRIATVPTAEAAQARALLAAYLRRRGASEMALSRASGVPQYTISKFLTGRIKSVTPEVEKFMRYADIGIDRNMRQLTDSPEIQRALGIAWDGSEQGIAVIADALTALAPLLRSAGGSRQKGAP